MSGEFGILFFPAEKVLKGQASSGRFFSGPRPRQENFFSDLPWERKKSWTSRQRSSFLTFFKNPAHALQPTSLPPYSFPPLHPRSSAHLLAPHPPHIHSTSASHHPFPHPPHTSHLPPHPPRTHLAPTPHSPTIHPHSPTIHIHLDTYSHPFFYVKGQTKASILPPICVFFNFVLGKKSSGAGCAILGGPSQDLLLGKFLGVLLFTRG